jgi:hypothetical protein
VKRKGDSPQPQINDRRRSLIAGSPAGIDRRYSYGQNPRHLLTSGPGAKVRVRGKKRLDMEIDPPPDLLIEIDVTTDSMDKFPLYAALRVPEVWTYEGSPEIWILDEARYIRRAASTAIPILDEQFITKLMESSLTMKRPAWARQTRDRIRQAGQIYGS